MRPRDIAARVSEPRDPSAPSTKPSWVGPSPFWRVKLALDDAFFAAASLASVATFWLDPDLRRAVANNRHLRDRHRQDTNPRVFVLGTAPSILEQDLSPLANEHTLAVNFFFLHPQAKDIAPKYWVIQDKRLWRGGWPKALLPPGTDYPGGMLDAIQAVSPNVTLFLHGDGRHDPPLTRAIAERGLTAHWLAGRSLFHRHFVGPTAADGPGARGNVMQTALTLADFLGFAEVHLLGLSLDGLPRELAGRPVHFYDAARSPSPRPSYSLEFDHLLPGYMIRGWRGLADHYRRKGHPTITNLTPDGHLDVFPRATLAEVLARSHPTASPRTPR